MAASTTCVAAVHARMTPAASYTPVHALASSTKGSEQGLKDAPVGALVHMNKASIHTACKCYQCKK